MFTNFRIAGSLAYRSMAVMASVASATVWLQSAPADPLLLRGDDGTTGFLKGQATVAAPAEPGINPGAGAALVGGAAAVGAAGAALHGAHQRGPMSDAGGGYGGGGRYHAHEHPVTTARVPEHRTYFQQHPKMRAALLGAGVGTAAGAVTGLVTHKGVFRGAAIGAGAGAGVGLIRSSQTLNNHPIVKDLATGTVAGLGLGMASSHHLGRKAGKLTAVGAALGLGIGVLRDKLK